MKDVEACLEAFDIESSLRHHENRDGSFDGEVIIHIGRGMSAVETAKKLEECFGTENMREIWFSVGVRFSVPETQFAQAETRYDRHKGMHEAWMYWRKMYRHDPRQRTSQIIDPFIAMETQMIPGIEDEYERKVQQIILRLNWNPANERPSDS